MNAKTPRLESHDIQRDCVKSYTIERCQRMLLPKEKGGIRMNFLM